MIDQNITISNNRVHDMGLDYRGITSFLPTYVTNATIAHNEVYNMPYSGISVGFGWGANDAGGSNDYANRGLYNYQPRYSTATTASNNQVIDNYVHDVMQQMNDGGCIYTLSANPNAVINGNYCLRTNGFFGLYFDEGSRYFTATSNVFSSTGVWSTANANANNNTGNLTLTGNWTTNGTTYIGDGSRGNVVNNNTTVTNGNWPSGAQAVMASAGVQSSGGGVGFGDRRWSVGSMHRHHQLHDDQRHAGAVVGLQRSEQPAVHLHLEQAVAGVRDQVPGRLRSGHHQRHRGDHLGLQRPGQSAVERQLQRHHHRRAVRVVRGRQRSRARRTARRSSSGPATGRPTSSGACTAD